MEIKDDFLLPSLEEELFLEFGSTTTPLSLLAEDSLLIFPLENSTSSEKETLELRLVADWLEDFLEEPEEEKDVLLSCLCTGTTTALSVEQVAQEATERRPTRGGPPLPSQKLSLAILRVGALGHQSARGSPGVTGL